MTLSSQEDQKSVVAQVLRAARLLPSLLPCCLPPGSRCGIASHHKIPVHRDGAWSRLRVLGMGDGLHAVCGLGLLVCHPLRAAHVNACSAHATLHGLRILFWRARSPRLVPYRAAARPRVKRVARRACEYASQGRGTAQTELTTPTTESGRVRRVSVMHEVTLTASSSWLPPSGSHTRSHQYAPPGRWGG